MGYGIAFTAGHDNVAANNRVISSGCWQMVRGSPRKGRHGRGRNWTGAKQACTTTPCATTWSAGLAGPRHALKEGYRKDQYFPVRRRTTPPILIRNPQSRSTWRTTNTRCGSTRWSAAVTVGPSFLNAGWAAIFVIHEWHRASGRKANLTRVRAQSACRSPSFAVKFKSPAKGYGKVGVRVKLTARPNEPGWRNWQTQRTQNPPRATSWGFDPPSRHQPNTGSIWQGCQISPLFHEDAQDDQAIYLIILRGRGGWVSRCGGKAGLEAAAFRSLDVRTSRSAGLRWFALRDNLLRAGKFREARCDRPRWVDPKIAYRTGQGSHELLPMLSNPAFGLFLR